MKLSRVQKFGLTVLVFIGLAHGAGQTASAAFVLGEPVKSGAPLNTTSDDWSMTITADGLTAYFSTARFGGRGSDDLWMVTRPTPNEPWGEPVNLGPSVNTSASEGYPSISADGLTLFFSEMFASTRSRPLRPGGRGGQDLWMTTRATTEDDWGTPVNLGPVVNSAADERCPCISADGLSLYFGSNRPGGSGTLDLWVSTRPDTGSDWTTPVNLGSAINSSDDDSDPSLSPDGLTLFFASWGRPEGFGSHDLYVATRASINDPWNPAVNLGRPVSSSSGDGCPCFWAGGPTLFFIRYGGQASGFDFWQLPITPTTDFNGDGKVDGNEVRILAERWGQDAPVADIAPAPFGDGLIDLRDLRVLADYIGVQVNDGTLRSHWAMDETEGLIVSDCMGGNDGEIIGLPQWRPNGGAVGGALELDGATFVTADAALSPADGPFSVLAWIKGGAPGQVVISQGAAANWLMADVVQGALATDLASDGRFGGGLSSQAVITDGNWHRIAFSWDGSSRRLYVDAVLAAQDTHSGLGGSSGTMLIGAGKMMTPDSFWSGLIDDVRIYNRVVYP